MLDFILSILYPKRCVFCKSGGRFICDNCFSKIAFLEYQLCGICQKGSIDGMTHPKCRTKWSIDGIISSIAYHGAVKRLIYQFKYPPYLSALKEDLGSLLYEGLIQQESFMQFILKENIVLTSVPLHKSRLNQRGYNQSELLAKFISEKLKIPYLNLIERKSKTAPQYRLKKELRLKNISDAFVINKKYKENIKGLNTVLVDDIVTSGATMRECAKVLKKGGVAKVLGAVLAHEG